MTLSAAKNPSSSNLSSKIQEKKNKVDSPSQQKDLTDLSVNKVNFSKSSNTSSQHCKPVILGGSRSAFVKSFGKFFDLSPLELFSRTVDGVFDKLGFDSSQVDQIIAGAVIPQIDNPNIARDTILNLKLPTNIHGFTLNQACASSLQSIALATRTIVYDSEVDFILAGGVECLSQVPICYSKGATKTMVSLSRAKNLAMKLKVLKKFRVNDWIPSPPSLLEPLTGLSMGEHGEIMAEKNNISRDSQDKFALGSHQKAYQAQSNGYLSEEIVPIIPYPYNKFYVDQDDLIRKDSSLQALSKLRPVFKKPFGTLTAGNSSALTDGASITLVGEYDKAMSLGYKPLALVEDIVFVGCDPNDQLLIGPALAIPKILHRNNLTINDIDRFEFHEAFAAQVLSCQSAMNSVEYTQKNFNHSKVIGSIPEDKINVNGGAIAIGHPFGASGSRIVNCLVNELQRNNLEYGLVSMCAAGGMAGCMLLRNIT